MKKPLHNLRSLLIWVVGVAMVFSIATFVQARGFIEPSDQAPKNNVLDFIADSGDAQARSGQLRIGSADIPTSGDPMLDVVNNGVVIGETGATGGGNIFIQGNTYFDRQASPAWQVVVSQLPHHVNSGTAVTNGKFTVQSTAGPAIYAHSSASDAVDVKTLSENAKAVFGQTIQVPGGSISAGVRGDAINVNGNGAGVYAKQANCPGSSDSDIAVCGNAAQFIGNVVVTGVIKGDGRGIVRTWTMNDASTTSAAKGISVKTFDIESTDFTGTPLSWSEANALPDGATFISMSVMVGASPYDSTTTDVGAINYDTASGTLTVEKGTSDENLVILMYYHQQLTAAIVDAAGNPVDPALALVGSGTPTTFRGTIGGGGFEGGQFLWKLYTGNPETDPTPAVCLDCGTVGESGATTIYTPPTTLPASGNTVWLKATWIADSSLSALQRIDLYDITFTKAPGIGSDPNYVLIGHQDFPFAVSISCPSSDTACTQANPITWSVKTSNGDEKISSTGGYTSPETIDSGSSWNTTVRAAINSHPNVLYQEKSFSLLPQISIAASVNEVDITSGGAASIGVSKTVVLRATALGIPPPISNDFTWSLQTTGSVSGESLTGGSAAYQTDNQTPDITYTAPNSVTAGGRTVTATWRSNGVSTAAQQTIQIYQGKGNNITFTQTQDTTGTKSATVTGFQTERRIYSFCTTLDCSNEHVVDYDALAAGTNYLIGDTSAGSLTGNCGTLYLTGPVNTNSTCDPNAQTCTLNSTFSYSATNAGLCTLRANLMGDHRQSFIITLDPTSGGGGCTCNQKTGYCCGSGGGKTNY